MINKSIIYKSIDLEDPLIKKQMHLKALYGPHVRNISPMPKTTSSSIHQTPVPKNVNIDEIATFNSYLKNLPNIDFKK